MVAYNIAQESENQQFILELRIAYCRLPIVRLVWNICAAELLDILDYEVSTSVIANRRFVQKKKLHDDVFEYLNFGICVSAVAFNL